MNIMILIGGLYALYLALFLVTKKKKSVPDYILAFLFIVGGITYIIVYIGFEYDDREILYYILNIELLLAPLLYLYVRVSTEAENKFRKGLLVHFLPYVITGIYYIYFINSIPGIGDRFFYSDVSMDDKPYHFVIISIIEYIYIPFYIIYAIILLRKHRANIEQSFSWSEGIDFNWLNVLLIFILTGWGIIVFVDIFGSKSFAFQTAEQNLRHAFAISSILALFLGYFGFKQTDIFVERKIVLENDEQKRDANKEKYKKSGLEEEKSLKILSDVKTWMCEEKAYLNPKLTIAELSQATGHSTHNISQALNEKAGMSFHDYINEYRIKEFMKKIENGDHERETLLSLAIGCGYNSKSSFNRVFKKLTGQTPSECIKKKESSGQ